MNTKVFVTGVTGKSGKCFFKELCSNANSLHCYQFDFLVRDAQKAKFLNDAPFDSLILEGDLSKRSHISAILKEGNYNIILNIAGISSSPLLVEEGVKFGVEWFILVHTSGIYSKYKKAGESYRTREKFIYDLLKNTTCKSTILRPTMIYGTLDDRNISVFIKMVDRLRLFPVIDGAKFEVQPVLCDDLGRAYFQCLTHKDDLQENDYVLSGASPIYLLDVFKEIGKQLGVNNRFITIPFNISFFAAKLLYTISFHKIDYREKVQRMVEPRAYPHNKATRDFGYMPVRFEEGVTNEIQMYKHLKK